MLERWLLRPPLPPVKSISIEPKMVARLIQKIKIKSTKVYYNYTPETIPLSAK